LNFVRRLTFSGQFEELLYTHKVDLVLWGHIHYAVATCPVHKKKCHEPAHPGAYDAPIHAVIGNAGQRLTPHPGKTAEWTKYVAIEHGYERILVHNATHMTMNFHANEKNEIHHTFTIVRNFPRD
jgi:hypothetical protein